MARTCRVSTTSVLIASLVIAPASGVLFANEAEPSVTTTTTTIELLPNPVPAPARSPFAINDSLLASTLFVPSASEAFAQRGGYRGRERDRGRTTSGHDGAAAALVLGAVASITGAAILVYANRPECSTNPYRADGCGYGTKVVGGAALSLGVVGFTIAAITW